MIPQFILAAVMLRFSWDVYFHLIASLVNPLFRFLFHTTHFVYQVCMNDCPLWIQQWTLGVIPEQLKIYFWLKNFKPRHSGRGGRETILSIQKTMQGRVKQYIEYRSKVEIQAPSGADRWAMKEEGSVLLDLSWIWSICVICSKEEVGQGQASRVNGEGPS